MHRFVRSTTIAILSAAALVACGDKVVVEEVVTPTPTPLITQVTVSGPTSYQRGSLPLDSLSYAANVIAEGGFTGSRAVTWSSNNPAVFDVNATTGRGQAKAAGSAVITATAGSGTNIITGSLSLTVTAAPVGQPLAPASIIIAQIRQGAGGPPGSTLGANVDLGNAGGQVNVDVDVSYDAANRPASIVLDLVQGTTVINCDSRPFGGTTAAAADQDVSTVTMSCRTDAFNATTGVTSIKNGTYSLRATMTGAAASSSTPAVTNITINNADFLRVSRPTTVAVAPAHPTAVATVGGNEWRAGSVQVTVSPIIYTPTAVNTQTARSIATATVMLVNGSAGTTQASVGALAGGGVRSETNGGADVIACGAVVATIAGAQTGSFTVTFAGTDSTTAAGVENVMVDTLVAVATAADAQGNGIAVNRANSNTVATSPASLPVYTAPTGGPCTPGAAIAANHFIRLDNRDPMPSIIDARVAGANNQAPINAVWLGNSLGFGTTPAGTLPTVGTVTNGLVVGVDIGSNANTVVYQYAPAGTARLAAGWTTVASVASIPESSSATTYNVRIITRDALGNADTSEVTGMAGAVPAAPAARNPAPATWATFGVDRTNPEVAAFGGPANSAIASTIACTVHTGCADVGPPTGTGAAVTVTASDPAGGSGTVTGSGFSDAPVRLTIRVVRPHTVANGVADQQVYCVVPAHTNLAGAAVAQSETEVTAVPGSDFNCDVETVARQAGITFPATQGDYRITYRVADQANNSSATTTRRYYIDNTPPAADAVPLAMQLPPVIAAGTVLATTGQPLQDSLDLWRANATINYDLTGGDTPRILVSPTTPTANPGLAGTIPSTSAALDQALFRRADASFTMPSPFFNSLHRIDAAGVITPGGAVVSKPNGLSVRAVDRAQNLSVPVVQTFPATNIAGDGSVGYTLGTHLNDFFIENLSSTSTATTSTTTITARVTAPSTATQSPFTQVCFYYVHPGSGVQRGAEGRGTNSQTFGAVGDLVLIGCTSSHTTLLDPVTLERQFDYTSGTFAPGSAWGTAASGGIFGIRAIGVNATGRALITNVPSGGAGRAGSSTGSCFRKNASAGC